jgi:YggT family protein
MGGIIQFIMQILAALTSAFMILVFIRILLTWFGGINFGKFYVFLCAVCDPYLNWFRRFRIFRNSPLDFSPLIGLAVLSFAHTIFLSWGSIGTITLSFVLIMILQAVRSIITWVLGFFIVVLVLRGIAFIGNFNTYSPFWQFVDYIAQPVMYRINRVFFPSRITGYLFRLVFSIFILLVICALVWLAAGFASLLLMQLPL